MSPTERRDVRQQLGRTVQPIMLSPRDGVTEMLGVPVDDYGGQQVQARHAEVLPFGGAIADFTLAADAQCVFQGMVGFAFVEADLGTSLHVGVEQPIDDEECPLDPSDFPQGHGQLVLPRIGSKLPQQLAWGHDACEHGRRAAQDIRPVCRDEAFLDLAADQPLQLFWAGRRVEEVEPLGWQISDARDELEAQKRGDGEDMVGEAASVGILFADFWPASVISRPSRI